jgi:hypothetical protein
MLEHLPLIGHQPSDRFADIKTHPLRDGREAGQYRDCIETRSTGLGDLILGHRQDRRETPLLQTKAKRDEGMKIAQSADRCQD